MFYASMSKSIGIFRFVAKNASHEALNFYYHADKNAIESKSSVSKQKSNIILHLFIVQTLQ